MFVPFTVKIMNVLGVWTLCFGFEQGNLYAMCRRVQHCRDSGRSQVILQLFRPVLCRILKHNVVSINISPCY